MERGRRLGGRNRPYDERLLSLIARTSKGKNKDKFIEKVFLLSVSIARCLGFSKYKIKVYLDRLVDAIYEIDDDA